MLGSVDGNGLLKNLDTVLANAVKKHAAVKKLLRQKEQPIYVAVVDGSAESLNRFLDEQVNKIHPGLGYVLRMLSIAKYEENKAHINNNTIQVYSRRSA